MYNLAELEAELAGSVFAGKLHFTPVTGSTNTDALAAGHAGCENGTVFFADEQTAGRGRSDHRWHSAAGEGLYVSTVHRLQLAMERMRLLPLVAGLAAAEAVESASGLKVDLRWPNDLLIGPRKAGGILVEASTQAGSAAFAVVGIGINVHQKSFDPALDTLATSLDIESGRTLSRQMLLIVLLKSLERETHALEDAAKAKLIPSRVEQISTWVRGRRVHVHGPQACTGVTSGLDENGFLRVETQTSTVVVHTGGLRAAEME